MNKNNYSNITPRSKINRLKERGSYDKETIYKIVDEVYYCHVSFAIDGQPFIIPTIHARIEDDIILHGAITSHLLKHVQANNEVCIAVTHIDGLVLARAIFHHSMNYRSAVLFGKGRLITDRTEKLNAAKAITDHLIPGRWDDARQPNQRELDSTSFVSIKIEDASSKVRTGPPLDEDDDLQLPVWAGVIPLLQVKNSPVGDKKLAEKIKLPDYLRF